MFATTGALAPQRSAPQRHSQPRDVACDSWAKGCYECLCQRVKSQVYLNFYQRAQPRFAEGNVLPVTEPFGSFQLWKERIERVEENTSERLRLKIASKWVYGNMFTYKTNESNFNEVKTVVEYNGERKRLFLIHPSRLCRWAPNFCRWAYFTCTMIISSPQVHKKKTEKAFQLSPFLYAVRDSNPGPID